MEARRLDLLLAAVAKTAASALHLVPGRRPALRVQRRFVDGDDTVLQAADVDELTRDLLFADHREQLARCGHVEVLYVARGGVRHRVTVVEADGNHALVLRPVPAVPLGLAAAGLPEQLSALTRVRSGFVVVAGFFGAGKSTTLAALVAEMNQDPGRHLVTIEEPIAFLHPVAAALLHQREVGTHVATAAAGIRQAMVVGADVIVIDEVRDAEALEAAVTAAESGCLVFAGVEAGSIAGAIGACAGLVGPEQRPRLRTRLARVLRACTAQSLLQRAQVDGRIPAIEILVGSQAVRAAIRRGNLQDLPAIMTRCRGLGMQTTDLALRSLLSRGLVTADEALLHATCRDAV
ncbi:MAG: ATPase, T2SS/T4P/T4SS family, partial [Planctomycetota bacterium]